MIFIVGLGNPGKEYQDTRHNAGFILLDRLLEIYGNPKPLSKFNGLVYKQNFSGKEILCIRPKTFMNLSGVTVAGAARHFEDILEKILVIHDDLDIEFGRIRFKTGGGTGGHNGLDSIIKSLGRADFDRLRIGVGRPPGKMDPADFVLSKFKKSEHKELNLTIGLAADAIADYIDHGIDYVMNKYNQPKIPG
ncbi:MAG TPA: aminoacyl-tRNA hydrolase [Candidatus Humimicrobiaceae bacterium]